MRRVTDVFGNVMIRPDLPVDNMAPVQCTHCSEIYDLTKVETVHRYADCTVFLTPCCRRTVDDRKWKSLPDFREMT